MSEYNLGFRKVRCMIWIVLTIFVLSGYSVQNVVGSIYYPLSLQSNITVTAPPVILQAGTAGTSTIYTNNTSALVNVVAPVSTYDFVDNNTSDVDGSPGKGTHSNFTAQQYGPDSTYDTLTEARAQADNNVDAENITHGNIGTTSITDAQTVNGVTENMTEGSTTTSTTIINYVSSAHHVNASAGNDAPPANPWTWDVEFSSGDYSAVNQSDEVWATTTGGGPTLNPAQIFEFYTSIDPATMTQLYFYWEGYGDAGTSTLHFWNWTSSSWVSLGSHANTTSDGIVSNTVNSSFTDYVNSTGYMELCAVDVNNKPTFIKTDYVYVNITYTSTEYQLDIEHVVNSIGNYENYNLTVRCYRSAENFYLQMYNFTSSQWVNFSTVTASSLAWYNTTFVKADFVNATNQARIRYWQGVDSTQETLYVDYSGIYGWNTTFELDLEVQWINANYTRTNEELCIKTGTTDAEDVKVDVWNGTTWCNIFTDLTANSWNNVSVTDYLTSSTFTIRFKGGTETGDTTQGNWNIDATLLHVWTENYDYVLKVNNTVAQNWNIRLKAYDETNIDRLQNCTIYFHNGGGTSCQIYILNGVYDQTVGDWYTLEASSSDYIAIMLSANSTGTSYVYVYLEILVPATSTYSQYVITFEIT